ncbi:tryptophan synthase beta subunit-like PLP-dependent enzyme [Mycotypha africana]|uniref:tryptophan synthase beta subunit-like PLP-dependent enzyme n=1 Tax=Mycotypha africana TaxID=64632 RepID=UPI002301A466|nr:tryptophan synthase beta subunit-like PLP-dependent enzyme [Mycotypha africana]KAI8971649.1 tryptophan synthase beta subunit-like PLP-dependent enzyme [Mycotypha africana]
MSVSTTSTNKAVFIGILTGSVLTVLASGIFRYLRQGERNSDGDITDTEKQNEQDQQQQLYPQYVEGVDGLIGNTPLMKIRSLSEATGCLILGKAEFLNPGGSSKDRVALNMIKTAEENGILEPHKGSTIFEGTVGSTGISIAMVARAKGYKAWIVMPDDQAKEKYQLLDKLGATVEKVRPVSIIDKKQFVNWARERAATFHDGDAVGYFADQFENEANFQAHYNNTGPEIYRQTAGKVDALVLGAGTGGTLSGITCYLKERLSNLKVFLADPQGSGLYNKVKYNVMYAPTEKEGSRKRHQVDTVVEGIGINRLTKNFDKGRHLVDDAFRVTDEEAIKMSRYLVREDGLFIGSSSAVNCVAAVRAAKKLGPGHVIVTLLNDSGQRHLTKFWSDDYLRAENIYSELQPEETVLDFVK